MEKKSIQPEKIIIREFRLIKGQIDSPYEFQIKNIDTFDFSVEFNAGFNLEDNLIRADFVINLATISKEKADEATSSYHFVFIFHVENLNEHTTVADDKSVDWNPYLANAIASITYSTSRGILMSRFQGTVMEDFILPVVDPNSLLRQEVVTNKLK